MKPALYETFSREAWGRLRDATPLTLGPADLDELRGLNEHLSIDEVEAIYLPLSRLLNLRVAAGQALHGAMVTFTGSEIGRPPYIIGMAGSVAVGKSTTARVMRALLSRWPAHPRVDLVTTDGFLYPNEELSRRGLMDRKGFPESYDVRRLLQFLSDVKSGEPETTAPEYSHIVYDVLPGSGVAVHQPDILIVEGVNVLQVDARAATNVSDFFDFSIYVEADVGDVRQWYLDRFATLYDTIFQQPASYFHRFAELTRDDALTIAEQIWRDVNERNLVENILPTRQRASLVLCKGPDHRVQEVRLRRF